MRFPRVKYWPLLVGPVTLFAIGFVLNAIVIAANHGQMPVLWPGGCAALKDVQDAYAAMGGDDSIHTCMLQASHLKFLADWIHMSDGMYSVGDLFIMAYDYTFSAALIIWIALHIKDHHDTQV